MNCYKILRIPQNASSEDIENAADRMTSIWNPEDFDDYREVALCVLDDIENAKRTLLDTQSRKMHDEKLEELYSESNDCAKRKVEICSHSGVLGFYNRPWIQSSESQGGQCNSVSSQMDVKESKNLEDGENTIKQMDINQSNDVGLSENQEDRKNINQIDSNQLNNLSLSENLENGKNATNHINFNQSNNLSLSENLENGKTPINQTDFNDPNNFSTPKNFHVLRRKTIEEVHNTSLNYSNSEGDLSSLETHSSENQLVDMIPPENIIAIRKISTVGSINLKVPDSAMEKRCEVVENGSTPINRMDFNDPSNFSTPKNPHVHRCKGNTRNVRSFDSVTSEEVHHTNLKKSKSDSNSVGDLRSLETGSSENQSVDTIPPENNAAIRKIQSVDSMNLPIRDKRCEVVDLTPQFAELNSSEASLTELSMSTESEPENVVDMTPPNSMPTALVPRSTNSVAQKDHCKTPTSGLFDVTEDTVGQSPAETNAHSSTLSTGYLERLCSMRRKLHEIEYSLDVQLSHFRKCVSDSDIATELFGSSYEDSPSSEGNIRTAKKSLSDSDGENLFRKKSSGRPNGAMVNDLSGRFTENIMKSSDDKEWMYGGKFREISNGNGVGQSPNDVHSLSPVTRNNLNGRSHQPPTERNIVSEDQNVSSSDNNDPSIDVNGVITLETNIHLDDDDAATEASSPSPETSSADEESFVFNRSKDSVTIGISKTKTKIVSEEGKSLTCSSVLKAEKSLSSSVKDFLKNEGCVVEGFVKASFEPELGKLVSHLKLEGFSMTTEKSLGEEGKFELYMDGKFLLVVENEDVQKHGESYLEPKCIPAMPLSMTAIINSKYAKLKIARFIGERREFIRLYRNNILFYELENTYPDNHQSNS